MSWQTIDAQWRAEWQAMLDRSFDPRQWFCDVEEDLDQGIYREERLMWVYRKSPYANAGKPWLVGFYDPSREWHEDSAHATREAAAERVNYLNGGIRSSA